MWELMKNLKQHLPWIQTSIVESTSKEVDSTSPSMQHRERWWRGNKGNDNMEAGAQLPHTSN